MLFIMRNKLIKEDGKKKIIKIESKYHVEDNLMEKL